MTRRLGDEAGYSLVEVLVAILILAVAIIPMVGMFDAGLRAADSGGNYDRARSLANLKLEEAKGLPYDSATGRDVKNDFPVAPSTPNASGDYDSPWRDPEAPLDVTYDGFQYKIEKRYLKQPTGSQDFQEIDTDQNLIKIEVSVRWSGNEYTTIGLVAK